MPAPGYERGTAPFPEAAAGRRVNGAWRVEAEAVWISDDGRGTGGGRASRRRADVSEIARPADRQTDALDHRCTGQCQWPPLNLQTLRGLTRVVLYTS